MYDISNIHTRLYNLRKSRYALYEEHEEKVINKIQIKNPYAKYAYCKTQETFATELGSDRRTIGKWENGSAIPTIENLIALSNALDCTVDYFLESWDFVEQSPIQTAAHFSNISPEIIRYGLNNPEYNDFLNFFMLPENCSALLNESTLTAWKKYWADQKLLSIKEPLKSEIINYFNEFNSTTPIDKLSEKNYMDFLKSKLTEEWFTKADHETLSHLISSKNSKSPHSKLSYKYFIDCVTKYTYDALVQNTVFEIKKAELSKDFISLFIKYLSQD